MFLPRLILIHRPQMSIRPHAGRIHSCKVRAPLAGPAWRLDSVLRSGFSWRIPRGDQRKRGLASRGEPSVWIPSTGNRTPRGDSPRRGAQLRFPAGPPSELAHGPPFIQAEAPTADRFSSDTVAGSVISWEVCSQRHGVGSPRLDWDLRLGRRGL